MGLITGSFCLQQPCQTGGMLERSAEIDDLAGRIFVAEHFCSRAIQAPEASEPAGEVRLWMELNDFDQAPIARSGGMQVVLRSSLVGVAPDRPVADLAMATPAEHWLNGGWQELEIEAR